MQRFRRFVHQTKSRDAQLTSRPLEASVKTWPARAQQVLRKAEKQAISGADFDLLLKLLRQLTLEQFGTVMWGMPGDGFPGLSAQLPAMAAQEVQRSWNGTSGLALLARTTWFPPIVANFLRDGAVLDVGCGYGRMVRLMYYYADPARIIGLDPWPQSVALTDNLPGSFRLVDAVPSTYPVDEAVDVAYAFSVLTHLPEYAATSMLAALRTIVRRAFVVTVRPVEYWRLHERDVAAQMVASHNSTGFAFRPHVNNPLGHYGDASVDLQYFNRVGGWRVAGQKRFAGDPYQIAVILEPS